MEKLHYPLNRPRTIKELVMVMLVQIQVVWVHIRRHQ
uniref:Uncharacterized protein n=1 Tax=Arundo donax TaxID=35708 RepID=A0A0A9ESR7_ARUDO